LRQFAINIIRAHLDAPKVKRAGWDDALLLDLFTHLR
jgi:hypothetical protein